MSTTGDISEPSTTLVVTTPIETPEERQTRLRAQRIANLRHWPKGVSGNPKGRPKAGLTIEEWFNAMQGKREDKLREIARDKKQPPAKRVAADQWLQALSQDKNKLGARTNGEAIDRIFDRTIGKATQRTEVSGPEGGPIQVEQRVTDLADCLRFFDDYTSKVK